MTEDLIFIILFLLIVTVFAIPLGNTCPRFSQDRKHS